MRSLVEAVASRRNEEMMGYARSLPDPREYRKRGPKSRKGRMARRDKPAFEARLRHLHGLGLNDPDIGDVLKLNRSSVAWWRKRLGLPPNTRGALDKRVTQ